ncbi:hypothetical protein C9374_006625 [Naegleria lovaniensis]|uniref:Uncharacterized protein n=1 Tax=Naegleria lovaniensis TaxID=51637 RepID=A0AA88GNE1_NAELO|nr:uncharacterized protein C9374_006625 [Naegleria lovaniensis]KAG2379508.1 hypothetical protein C9374_006625 [Naegleria lovaniensis]
MARIKRGFSFRKSKRKFPDSGSSSDVLDIEAKKRKQVSDLIKEALNDAKNGRDPDYSNISTEVQEWIVQDRNRRENDNHPSSNNFEMDAIALSLLRSLPRDLLYDIIDFIPTFSTRYCLRASFDNIKHNSTSSGVSPEDIMSNLCDPLHPKELNKRRAFDCAMIRDSSFITFHKMRLICREYAVRMKHKLFSFESIDMSTIDLDDFEIAKYFFAFIKSQSQYFANKDHSDNDPLMYQCVSTIDSLVDQESESEETSSQKDDEPVLQNGNVDSKMDVSSDDATVVETSSANNGEDTTSAATASSSSEAGNNSNEMREKIVSNLQNMAFLHPLSCHSMRGLYIRSAPIELSSTAEMFDHQDVKTPKVKETVQFIGTNKHLKSLALFVRDASTVQVILQCCSELTSLTFFDVSPDLSDLSAGVEDNEAGTSQKEASITYPSLKTLTLDIINEDVYSFIDNFTYILELFPNLTHIVVNNANADSADYIDEIEAPEKKNASFYVNGTKVRDCNLPTRGRNKAPQERVIVYFTTLANANPQHLAERLLKSALNDIPNTITEVFNLVYFDEVARLKPFMDCLFRDGCFPIEQVDLTYYEYEQKHYSQIREYLVYLANTYQNGRFANSFSTSSVSDALRLGLKVENWDEILFRLPHDNLVDVLDHVRSQYGNDEKFAKLIRAVILKHLKEVNYEASCSILLNTLKYLSEHTELAKGIFEPVKCLFVKKDLEKVTTEKTMHIPFIYYILPFSDYLVQTCILNFISPEQLLYQNENGDTGLHCFAAASSDLFLEQVLAKQPKLAQVVNKQNRGIAFMFENDSAVLFRLAKSYHADLLQEDVLGNHPCEGTEELLSQVKLALSIKQL